MHYHDEAHDHEYSIGYAIQTMPFMFHYFYTVHIAKRALSTLYNIYVHDIDAFFSSCLFVCLI